MMTEKRLVIRAEFRNGRWHSPEDAPIPQRIVAERLKSLADMVREQLPGVEVKVTTDLPEEVVTAEREVAEVEEAYEKLAAKLKEARKARRVARLRRESAYRDAGFYFEDAAFMLGMNPRTLRNHWYSKTEGE